MAVSAGLKTQATAVPDFLVGLSWATLAWAADSGDKYDLLRRAVAVSKTLKTNYAQRQTRNEARLAGPGTWLVPAGSRTLSPTSDISFGLRAC